MVDSIKAITIPISNSTNNITTKGLTRTNIKVAIRNRITILNKIINQDIPLLRRQWPLIIQHSSQLQLPFRHRLSILQNNIRPLFPQLLLQILLLHNSHQLHRMEHTQLCLNRLQSLRQLPVSCRSHSIRKSKIKATQQTGLSVTQLALSHRQTSKYQTKCCHLLLPLDSLLLNLQEVSTLLQLNSSLRRSRLAVRKPLHQLRTSLHFQQKLRLPHQSQWKIP